MGARAVLTLLLGACVCFASRSRTEAAHAFALPTDRKLRRPPPVALVARTATAGSGAELKQFVRPKQRLPGHSVLAFFRAIGLMWTMFCLSAGVVPAISAGLPALGLATM
ncbi:LPAT1 [Symbiodinium necroappetens]|uniref:LPAT1 protein n=1 Tax=Symbiodinium necroappetens TaxID=1628268 RepID=A0A812ZWS4_9DINO|nr:LPAT1 [Symbiodinium necroappetens]